MATKNSLVKQAELVPQLDQSSLRLALTELQDDLAVIPEWKAKSESLVVCDAATFASAGQFRSEVRSQRKQPKFRLERFQEVAKRVTDFLKTKRSEAEAEFDAIDNQITSQLNVYAAQERQAAEAEQRRINEEKRLREEKEAAERRRQAEIQAEADRNQREKEIAEARKAGEIKAADAKRLQKEAEEKSRRDKQAAAQEEVCSKENFQTVEVKPNLPTIAGSRRHRVFSAEFTEFPKLLESWRQAKNNGSLDRAAYLVKFITGDEKELGREARDMQDSKKLETAIPGIKAWDKDKT